MALATPVNLAPTVNPAACYVGEKHQPWDPLGHLQGEREAAAEFPKARSPRSPQWALGRARLRPRVAALGLDHRPLLHHTSKQSNFLVLLIISPLMMPKHEQIGI